MKIQLVRLLHRGKSYVYFKSNMSIYLQDINNIYVSREENKIVTNVSNESCNFSKS